MLTQQETSIVKDNLSLEEIEKLLSVENILENPRLLDMMDDNLTISITDFCLYYKLSKNTIYNEKNIIQELSDSKNYVFDEFKRVIQRRERGLRRIILFQEVDSGISLKDFLTENGIMEKVVDIDESNKDYIKVFFDSEEEALEAIKKIEKIKWENELSFRCQIKCESFKCNISNQMYQKDLPKESRNISLKNEIYIVLDKENYTPRILEPDNYSKSFENKDKFFANNNNKKPFYKNNRYHQEYVSNSTKESTEENDTQRKQENRKLFYEIYEKLKKSKNLQMPYLMKKYFNPIIMERQGDFKKGFDGDRRRLRRNEISSNRKGMEKRKVLQF